MGERVADWGGGNPPTWTCPFCKNEWYALLGIPMREKVAHLNTCRARKVWVTAA